jgi:hypothetical protein
VGRGCFLLSNYAIHSCTRLIPASAFLFLPAPDWLDAGQCNFPALVKCSTLCTYTLQKSHGLGYILRVHTRLLLVLFLLFEYYDVEKSYVNAGMSEYRRKGSPASAFLQAADFIGPLAAFRHLGSVRYRWSRIIRHCPAKDGKCIMKLSTVIQYMFKCSFKSVWQQINKYINKLINITKSYPTIYWYKMVYCNFYFIVNTKIKYPKRSYLYQTLLLKFNFLKEMQLAMKYFDVAIRM